MSPWLFNLYMDEVVEEVQKEHLEEEHCCRVMVRKTGK